MLLEPKHLYKLAEAKKAGIGYLLIENNLQLF